MRGEKILQDGKVLVRNQNCQYVWYVTYGTNILRSRFMLYIEGGKLEATGKLYEGCNDKSPPIHDKPFTIPYELYYGLTSSNWDNAGIAFIDADISGITLGRAYLITREQFYDIQKQESPKGKWYGRIVELPSAVGDIPHLTFTGEKRHRENPPSQNYLEVVHQGICETYPQMAKYSQVHRLLGEAVKHIGKPYVTGDRKGDGPDAFDCSGFVRWVFKHSGVCDIPMKWRKSCKLSDSPLFVKVDDMSNKQKGDLLFFSSLTVGKGITHVGIYLGHDMMIHATQRRGIGSVCIVNITEGSWSNRLEGVRRFR